MLVSVKVRTKDFGVIVSKEDELDATALKHLADYLTGSYDFNYLKIETGVNSFVIIPGEVIRTSLIEIEVRDPSDS